jgi:isocitrate dehydrogenase
MKSAIEYKIAPTGIGNAPGAAEPVADFLSPPETPAEKIQMKTPLVEMDGDEMTRVIWAKVKELLIEPFVDLNTEYYDLGLANREETGDAVTTRAAEAIKRHGVGVKCATITPNEERVKEYGLSGMYKSPNGTIRAILDGTVFRAPILCKGIVPYIPTWKKPITIARHAYGDIYKNVEYAVPEGAKAKIVITASGTEANAITAPGTAGNSATTSGTEANATTAPGAAGNSATTSGTEANATTAPGAAEKRLTIHEFDGTAGVVQGVHNTDKSIASFARACMNFAADTKQDLWFGTKDTISKTYDRRFRDIFQNVYDTEYKEKFEQSGIEYFYTLIDDIVARVVRSEGGFIWACKNYDGDVMSDMVATAYGSLAMMSSVLVSPNGYYEYEAAHGTVQKHYYKYKNGEQTSTNSVATIYAWAGALGKRGELDGLENLRDFGAKLERACVRTIEDGVMTGDLYALAQTAQKQKVDTETFLKEVAMRLKTII